MKRILSAALALVMCLALLPSTAMAAGTEKVVVNEERGVKVIMDGFLRTETNTYLFHSPAEYYYAKEVDIYVVADNSTVTVEDLGGEDSAHDCYGYSKTTWIHLGGERFDYEWDFACVLEDTPSYTYTVSPAGSAEEVELVGDDFGILWVCESDFAKLVPATLKASTWAQETVKNADAANLMYSLNPYIDDCTKAMSRAEFACTALRLYTAMTGKNYWDVYEEVGDDHPFTDMRGLGDYSWDVGIAYNLGFVNGKSATSFDPNGTLTRQEAAVILSRVYAKVHGDIPNVTKTTFADDKDVGSWAKSAVAFMSDKGIVNGVGDNRFAPTKTLSVEESIVMAYRMLEKLK